MTGMEKYIKNIEDFCKEHNVIFDSEGECGFCRQCVGIRHGDTWVAYNPTQFPDHDKIPEFYDEKFYEIAPKSAYHKHDCLAVLGRGEEAIKQLSEWVDGLKEMGVTIESYSTGATGIQAMISGIYSYAVKPK